MNDPSRRAFTLIGLLLVIAMIASLFPVFAKAREAVRATHCRGNLKQVGAALMLYTAEAR